MEIGSDMNRMESVEWNRIESEWNSNRMESNGIESNGIEWNRIESYEWNRITNQCNRMDNVIKYNQIK